MKQKVWFWAIAAIVVVALALRMIAWMVRSSVPNDVAEMCIKRNAAGQRMVEVQPPVQPAPEVTARERKPVAVEAAMRFRKDQMRTVRAVLVTTGRGENAKWGLNTMAAFALTQFVEAEATVLECEATPLGYVKVVEKRKFLKARDRLMISDMDVALALDTVPFEYARIGALGVASFFDATQSTLIATAGAFSLAKRFDGTSVRAALGYCGMEIDGEMEQSINEFAGEKLVEVRDAMRRVEGNTYIITYLQSAGGEPMHIDFAYEDGSAVKTEEEYRMLRRVNSFIDSHLLPKKRCSPGDEWRVDAESFADVMALFSDEDVEMKGGVTMRRLDDNQNGDWVLEVVPSSVEMVTGRKSGSGAVEMKSGRVALDSATKQLVALELLGEGQLRKLAPHHLLFKTRLKGKCRFRGSVTVDLQSADIDHAKSR